LTKKKTETDVPSVGVGEKLSFGFGPHKTVKMETDTSAPLSTDQDVSDLRRPTTKGLFGSQVLDSELEFALKREPAAKKVVYDIAKDTFDNWFKIVQHESAENKIENLDSKIQKWLTKLNAKTFLIMAQTFARLYGWSIMVLNFVDNGDSLEDEVSNPTDLLALAVYAKTQVRKIDDDEDIQSPRHGYPEYYTMYAKNALYGKQKIHHTRIIHVPGLLLDHRYKGHSVLEVLHDDMLGFRYFRWGVYMSGIRHLSGFPDIELQGADKKKIDEFIASGQFDNLNAQRYFVHNEKQKLEFKGAQSVALNPLQYYPIPLEQISLGSGIPEPQLRGAQAGALTGSEENTKAYFKIVSDEQTSMEPVARQLIDWIIKIKLSEDSKDKEIEYFIEWNPGFELSEREKAEIRLMNAQASALELKYMMIDEVRKKNNLEDLPDGEGKKLLTEPQPQSQGGGFPFTVDVGEVNSNDLEKQIQMRLYQIREQYMKDEVTLEEAVLQARMYIEEQVTRLKNMEKRNIEARVGHPVGIGPERERYFENIVAKMVGDFKRILQDSKESAS
jgi:hypothetical protein